jgi:hypothetical protein
MKASISSTLFVAALVTMSSTAHSSVVPSGEEVQPAADHVDAEGPTTRSATRINPCRTLVSTVSWRLQTFLARERMGTTGKQMSRG